MALHAVVEADRRRADGAVVAGELDNLFLVEPGDLRDAVRRIVANAHFELLESQRIAIDVVAIEQILPDQHVHHAQRQRRVGPGHQRKMSMTFLRGLASIRIDRDQLGAAALCLLHPAPQMKIGYDRVRAPDENQSRVLELLHVDADGSADRRRVARLAGRGADRPIEQRCAELVKEAAIHGAVLQQPHGARIAVWQDRLRTVSAMPRSRRSA